MRQKSHTRTEFRLLAPFLLWGAVVLLFYLLTFFLANKLRTRMVEPRRAVAIMGSLSRRALIDALEWVVETHQVEQNDPYVSSGIDLLRRVGNAWQCVARHRCVPSVASLTDVRKQRQFK